MPKQGEVRKGLPSISHVARRSFSETTEEDFTLISRFYAAAESSKQPLYRRQALVPLLNNWSGEVDKARAWAATALDPEFDKF